MDVALVDQVIELLEKANADLQPELLPAPAARKLMGAYARAEKLAGFGVTSLSRKVADAAEVARATGTSMGKAKDVVATGKVLESSAPLASAMQAGEVSLDQAAAIASAEESSPGAAEGLLQVAKAESFHVLKDRARAVKLEAEQHHGLAERQRAARSARSYSDALGMVHVHLALEPHVGTSIVARAEAEAQRIARESKKKNGRGNLEPFERYLADAYAKLLSGSGKGRTTRPEVVVLVSQEVAERGWTEVRPGEVCKIPGVGPVAPEVAKAIAKDAF